MVTIFEASEPGRERVGCPLSKRSFRRVDHPQGLGAFACFDESPAPVYGLVRVAGFGEDRVLPRVDSG